MAQWQGVHYSDSDVLHMQQEAIRRVRQMQQRARQNLQEGVLPGGAPDIPAQPAPVQPSVPVQPPPPAQAVPPPPGQAAAPPGPGGGRGPSSPPPPPPGPSGGSPGLGNLGGLGERLGQLIEGGEQGQSICRLLDLLVQGSSPISEALSALGLDGERLLLLGLLLLLWNEQADRTLLLALGYLLL